MRLLYNCDLEVASFVDRLTPGPGQGFGPCSTIGVIDETDALVGGMVYHNYAKEYGVVEMSGASTTPRWLARHVLREIFDYPLRRLGCQMVIMRVDPSDGSLHRILKSIGFDLHTIPRLRGRGRAEFVFTLTDDRWLSSKFSRKPHGEKAAVRSSSSRPS